MLNAPGAKISACEGREIRENPTAVSVRSDMSFLTGAIWNSHQHEDRLLTADNAERKVNGHNQPPPPLVIETQNRP